MVFSRLVPRFPALRLAEPAGPLAFSRDTLTGGLVRLPVTWYRGAHITGLGGGAARADALAERGDLQCLRRVLDVRPAEEYAAGHIAGARSVPVAELRRHLRALPARADVVACCRGPYCVYADGTVRELARHGLRARRLDGGYPRWKQAGLPVAAGGGG